MMTPKSKESLTSLSPSLGLWIVSLDHGPLDHVSGSRVSGPRPSGSCLWIAHLWTTSLDLSQLKELPLEISDTWILSHTCS